MAIREMQDIPRELPPAKLYLDDVEDIVGIFTNAADLSKVNEGTQPDVTFTVKNFECDKIEDRPALQFTGTTYPISSTLQGKANVQVSRASDGLIPFSAGNYTFSTTVTDSGQNGFPGKQFSLTVYASNGVPYHTVPSATPLQGGNVVVHLH